MLAEFQYAVPAGEAQNSYSGAKPDKAVQSSSEIYLQLGKHFLVYRNPFNDLGVCFSAGEKPNLGLVNPFSVGVGPA